MIEMVKLRNDINEMVKSIEFKRIKTRYNFRDVAVVTFFNDEIIEFKDSEGLYDLFMAYRKVGQTNFIKSKKLIEEYKSGSVDIIEDQDEQTNTYVCVLFELDNGQKYRLFPARRYVDRKIIDLYYDLYKKNKKQSQPVQNK